MSIHLNFKRVVLFYMCYGDTSRQRATYLSHLVTVFDALNDNVSDWEYQDIDNTGNVMECEVKCASEE